MDLSIIICSWNVKSLLQKCLHSIIEQTKSISYEIIVVDNASTDGSVDMVKTNFPSVKLLAEKNNWGFAKANNLGAAQASGEFVILLNPDTELLSDALSQLVDFLRQQPRVGIVGPRLLNSDQTLQPSIRRFPRYFDQAMILTKLPNFFPALVAGYTGQDFNYNKTQPVEQVMGAALMTRRVIIEKLGLLDEYFWQYFDEIDFCQRVTEAGWQNYYLATAEILHHKGTAFSQQRALFKQYHWTRSLWYYTDKHWSAWQRWLLLPWLGLGFVLAAVQQVIKIKRRKPAYL